MIDFISGTLAEKNTDFVVVEACGIGYKIAVSVSTFDKISTGAEGSKIKFYVVEAATSMYGGVLALYGFLTKAERETFLLIKDEVSGTGAKKAMEYFDKASKSITDFKRAVIAKDIEMLTGIFGFTKKTAEKLTAALKDKIVLLETGETAKWADSAKFSGGARGEAVAGLVAMGFKEAQAREAVSAAVSENAQLSAAEIIKKALQHL
jgi:Holliday junction DNA helicase RuvA